MKKMVFAATLFMALPLIVCAQSKGNYDEFVGTMTRQLRTVQDDNARLEQQISELERKNAALEASCRELQSSMAELKRRTAAEAEARDDQFKRIMAQLDKLASMPAAAPTPARTSRTQDVGDTGVYEEYVVQPGATLSAIAKAYGVSVSDIKKVNGMKDDRLTVGRKLKIPVKQ